MKRLRQICAVTVLTILLTNVASADEGISHPWYVPPPTPTPTATAPAQSGFTTNGELNTNSEGSTIDLATEIAMHIIQDMLALF